MTRHAATSDKGHGTFKIYQHGAEFLAVFKAHQWEHIVKYVPIGETKKTAKKTSHVVNFIVSMALTPSPLRQELGILIIRGTSMISFVKNCYPNQNFP